MAVGASARASSQLTRRVTAPVPVYAAIISIDVFVASCGVVLLYLLALWGDDVGAPGQQLRVMRVGPIGLHSADGRGQARRTPPENLARSTK